MRASRFARQPRCSAGRPTRRPRSSRCFAASEGVSLRDLEAKLDAAIASEDYGVAAKLRDEIAEAKQDERIAVEYANSRFYEAFRNGDLSAMDEIWGDGDHVQCINPSSHCLAGREHVMEGWRMILDGIKPGLVTIQVSDVRTAVHGGLAFVTCVEKVDAGDSRGMVAATNVFELQHGRWKIVHHAGTDVPFGKPK